MRFATPHKHEDALSLISTTTLLSEPNEFKVIFILMNMLIRNLHIKDKKLK